MTLNALKTSLFLRNVVDKSFLTRSSTILQFNQNRQHAATNRPPIDENPLKIEEGTYFNRCE